MRRVIDPRQVLEVHQASLTGYYDSEAAQQFKKLSKATRVPQSAYLREALDDLLEKYASTLRKQEGRRTST